MRDPYEVLGVAKDASAKDIKSAFRKLAKKHHPDQNPNDPKAKDRFAAVNQAYEVVGDEKSRAAFDRGEIGADGKPKFQGFEGAAGGDPFAGFRRSGRAPGGARFEFRSSGPGADMFGDGDILSELFGQAFSGGGRQNANPFQKGPTEQAEPQAVLDVTIEEAATAAKVNALFADGRRMAVKLPEYIEDGQTIRLGEALARIRFRKHPRYRVEGRDLHADVPVALGDAVLGAKVAVETPTGKLAVNLPAWSSSDKVLRLKGRGLPKKGGGHGDLYAHVRVMLPEGGDRELEALLRKKAG
ncbi:MAG: J domain-containing protein [Rhizobiaceae bacterium]|nr:J domain-containing protein [Rhizobiaceae bacterium]